MKPRDNDGETYIFDPYASDDPNVGEVHYGAPDASDASRAAPANAGGAHDVRLEQVFRDSTDDGAAPSDGGLAEADVEYDFEPELQVPIRHDRPRGKKNISAAIDGDPDEGSFSRRNSAGEPDADDGEALSQKQLRRRVQSKSRRAGRRRSNPAILAMAIVYALVIGACVFYAVSCRHGSTDDPGQTNAVGTEALGQNRIPGSPADPTTPVGSDEPVVVPDTFVTVDVPSASVCEGDLILVNYYYPYTFPEKNIDVSIYANKSGSYKVRDTVVSLSKPVITEFNRLMDDFAAATGCDDVIVVSGFRDYDSQNKIWTDRVQSEGREEAEKYVALPGYSEHHTALAMDLSVYLDNGTSVAVADYEPCDWFEQHAPEYGFVLRYPAAKADITLISFEGWHYRYVGVPHAEIMTEREKCLEEYIDFVRTYRVGERYLAFDGETSTESRTFPTDAEYVVYFVPRSSGETTQIPVPDGAEYTISGNNVDGFIVTVKCK